jgi:N-sulfoglucosamine sulfohydrolase
MRLLIGCLGLFALVLAGPAAARGAEAKARNVLLLIADGLGLQVGCYGDAKARTPNLDAPAKDGVRLSHAFAAVSSCSPSRATLSSGLHTHTSGQYGLAHAEHNFSTRPGVKSLPGLLGKAGYRTGIVGKIHVQPRSVYPFGEEITKGLAGNRDVAAMARAARKFFEAGDRPFCLVVGFSDPHRAAKGFANSRSYPGVKEVRFGPKDVTLPYFLPDRLDARRDLADYYQAVNRLDQGVGLVLDALKKAGRADSTLVIFLSDNGIPFPWPGRVAWPLVRVRIAISGDGELRLPPAGLLLPGGHRRRSGGPVPPHCPATPCPRPAGCRAGWWAVSSNHVATCRTSWGLAWVKRRPGARSRQPDGGSR